jgi:hypothetical protein
VLKSWPALVLLSVFLSKCSGFTRVGEDSSETAFLLVENYNYDCFKWTSVRLGIFHTFCIAQLHFSSIIVACRVIEEGHRLTAGRCAIARPLDASAHGIEQSPGE